MNKKQLLRITLSLIGVLLIGFSIGMSRMANLGTDPFTTFNLGLSGFFNIQFGTYMLITNLIGLIIVFLAGRRLIGIGTLFSMILVGYVSDFVVNVWTTQLGAMVSIMPRFMLAAVSLVVLAIGAGMYIGAGRGVAPYDAFPIIMEEKTNGKLSFQVSKIILDITSIVIGVLFGSTWGIITIISGFFVGPLIQFFRTRFTSMLEVMEDEQLTLQNEKI